MAVDADEVFRLDLFEVWWSLGQVKVTIHGHVDAEHGVVVRVGVALRVAAYEAHLAPPALALAIAAFAMAAFARCV